MIQPPQEWRDCIKWFQLGQSVPPCSLAKRVTLLVALCSSKMIEVVESKGYRIVLGNCFSFDFLFARELFLKWYLMFAVAPGSIIILHDRKVTSKVLSEVLPWLKSKGYKIITLSELVRHTE